MKIMFDNQSAIAFVKNQVHHNRTKHVGNKIILLGYIPSKQQVAGMFWRTILVY